MFDPVLISAWIASVLFFLSRANATRWVSVWPRVAIWLNQTGAVAMWVHIFIAYWIAHGGSHEVAVEHVAKRTYEAVGLQIGIGIYANFAVAMVWTTTAFACKQGGELESPGRGRVFSEVFLWFMFLCATIPFAHRWTAAVFSCLAVLVLLSRVDLRKSSVGSPGPHRDAAPQSHDR